MHRARPRLVGRLADALLPLHCLACATPLASEAAPLGLCRRCQGQLAPVDPRRCCRRCLRPLPPSTVDAPCCLTCAGRPGPLARLAAAWWYREPLRTVVHAMKFRRLDFLAERLAREALARETLVDAAGAELIVPVPLPLWRRLARGFNQAEGIAVELGRASGLPVVDGVARRSFVTRPQSRLGRAARRRNPADDWRLRPALRSRLAGRSVLLVDDVVTTGATLASAAELLRQEGAREVSAFALAATPDRLLERAARRLDSPSHRP
jgi:ComF family protein